MVAVRARKVTVSMPADLVEYVDGHGAKSGKSRSQVISECLASSREQELEELAAEGYRFYAQESVEFAQASARAAAEALADER